MYVEKTALPLPILYGESRTTIRRPQNNQRGESKRSTNIDQHQKKKETKKTERGCHTASEHWRSKSLSICTGNFLRQYKGKVRRYADAYAKAQQFLFEGLKRAKFKWAVREKKREILSGPINRAFIFSNGTTHNTDTPTHIHLF